MLNIGDKVRVKGTKDIGIITHYDGTWYTVELDFPITGIMRTLYTENNLELINNFKVGDKVRVKGSTEEGEISAIDLTTKFIHVTFLNTTPSGYYTIAYSENYLELVHPLTPIYTSSGVYTYTFPTIGSWMIDLPNENKLEKRIGYQQHKCSFKTYTGLMYKEEYCDSCGATKNRRGIYE